MKHQFLSSILRNNVHIIIIFFLCSFIVFFNTLRNDFTVIDDLTGIVNNPTIRSISESFKTLSLQMMIYSISYALFGLNPLPLRILAIFSHAFVAINIYFIMRSIFNKKVGLISGLLFLVHPVTTESINWISAQAYIFMSVFLYSAVASHILYRKTDNKKFLFLTAGIITLEFILIRHAWVMTVPFAILLFDFFLVKKKLDFKFYSVLAALLAPVLIFYIFSNLSGSIDQRQQSRQAITGKTLMNQQLLAPVYEGYPYSIFTLVRLYTFPKDLTIYYDGNPVTQTDLIYMRIVLALYIALILYFFFKDKRISGLLILILLLIAAVFAPQKITWYMTERYLYAGTGLFTTLLALSIVFIEKKIHWQKTSIVITTLLFVLYSVRTLYRNNDWKNTETIAQATIRTSPYTIRPYNDLGGYYTIQKRYAEAKQSYTRALKVGKSETSMRNLGYIYFQTGLDPEIKTLSGSYEDILMQGLNAQAAQEYDLALYYFNEAYALNSADPRILNSLGMLYAEGGQFESAETYLQKSLEVDSENAETYYVLGFIAFKQGNKTQAIGYLQKALLYNPGHQGAQTNLNFLNQSP